MFLFLLEQLLREYSDAEPPGPSQELTTEIKIICEYIESHYADSITLHQLSELTGLSKYHLLRLFTKQKGISPYCYLETIRINHAKRLLEQGLLPIGVAFQTGFSDQSHFTIDFTPVEILLFRFLMGYLVLFLIYSRPIRTKSFKEELLFISAGLCGA